MSTLCLSDELIVSVLDFSHYSWVPSLEVNAVVNHPLFVVQGMQLNVYKLCPRLSNEHSLMLLLMCSSGMIQRLVCETWSHPYMSFICLICHIFHLSQFLLSCINIALIIENMRDNIKSSAN